LRVLASKSDVHSGIRTKNKIFLPCKPDFKDITYGVMQKHAWFFENRLYLGPYSLNFFSDLAFSLIQFKSQKSFSVQVLICGTAQLNFF